MSQSVLLKSNSHEREMPIPKNENAEGISMVKNRLEIESEIHEFEWSGI